MPDNDYPKPVVHSEKGYDQSEVPSEQANAEPDQSVLDAAAELAADERPK